MQPILAPTRPLKTFVIPKTNERSKVFGFGYPSRPTQTVDEWYDQMASRGHFHNQPSTSQPTKSAAATAAVDGDDDDDRGSSSGAEADAADVDSAEQRKRQREKDEYLDSHRRGWGNRHGKG